MEPRRRTCDPKRPHAAPPPPSWKEGQTCCHRGGWKSRRHAKFDHVPLPKLARNRYTVGPSSAESGPDSTKSGPNSTEIWPSSSKLGRIFGPTTTNCESSSTEFGPSSIKHAPDWATLGKRRPQVWPGFDQMRPDISNGWVAKRAAKEGSSKGSSPMATLLTTHQPAIRPAWVAIKNSSAKPHSLDWYGG